jgi:hypothetical protein
VLGAIIRYSTPLAASRSSHHSIALSGNSEKLWTLTATYDGLVFDRCCNLVERKHTGAIGDVEVKIGQKA